MTSVIVGDFQICSVAWRGERPFQPRGGIVQPNPPELSCQQNPLVRLTLIVRDDFSFFWPTLHECILANARSVR